MNRTIQIIEAAEKESEFYDFDLNASDFINGFRMGANWADEHPLLTKQVDDDGTCVVIHCSSKKRAEVIAKYISEFLTHVGF